MNTKDDTPSMNAVYILTKGFDGVLNTLSVIRRNDNVTTSTSTTCLSSVKFLLNDNDLVDSVAVLIRNSLRWVTPKLP